jgi:hypothetical protein
MINLSPHDATKEIVYIFAGIDEHNKSVGTGKKSRG